MAFNIEFAQQALEDRKATERAWRKLATHDSTHEDILRLPTHDYGAVENIVEEMDVEDIASLLIGLVQRLKDAESEIEYEKTTGYNDGFSDAISAIGCIVENGSLWKYADKKRVGGA